MEITPLGHSSFKIRTKTAVVITDPYDSERVGLKFPRHLSADVVTVSHQHSGHNIVSQIEGFPFVIKGPGEYEIKDVAITGINSFHDSDQGSKSIRNTIYRIVSDGLSIVHLGDLGHALSNEQLNVLDGVDILLVPTGATHLDLSKTLELISAIEPSVVVPMHYGRVARGQDNLGKLAPLSAFLKEIGQEGVAPAPKLTISKDKLPEKMQVVVLE